MVEGPQQWVPALWEQTPPPHRPPLHLTVPPLPPHRPHATPAPLPSPVHPLTAARVPPVALFLEQSSSPSGYPTRLMACLMFASLPAWEPHESGRPITPEPTRSPVWTAGHCRLQPDGDTSVDTSPQLASWPPSARAVQQGWAPSTLPQAQGSEPGTLGAHMSRGRPQPESSLAAVHFVSETARAGTTCHVLQGAPWGSGEVRSALTERSEVLRRCLGTFPLGHTSKSAQRTTSLFRSGVTGASPVVQWLRIRLPMQGTRVQALAREDPACHRATKPMSHSY